MAAVSRWSQTTRSSTTLPAGYGVDDGAALVFRGRELLEVVASQPEAATYRVEPDGAGGVTETRLPSRFLGA